jgi:hypothetical protein
MKYLFTMLLIGFVAGFLLAHLIGVEPRIIHKETQYFKDAIVTREGDTIWFVFQCKEEYVGWSSAVSEPGRITGFLYETKPPEWSDQ